MKNLMICLALIMFTDLSAQETYMLTCISGDSRNNLGLRTADMEMAIEGNRTAIGKIEGFNSVINLADNINSSGSYSGSTLLYNNWSNYGVIQVAGEEYKVKNINFDIQRGEFMSKLKNGSFISYDFKGIEQITVNDDVFKVLFDNQTNSYKVYQILMEEDEFTVLKGFDLKVVEAEVNPMLNRSSRKLKKQESLFVRQNSNIRSYKGNKRKILKYIDNDDRLALMKALNVRLTGEALASKDNR